MIVETGTSPEEKLYDVNSSSIARLKHEIFSALKKPTTLFGLYRTLHKILSERRAYQKLHPLFEALHAGWDISIPMGSMDKLNNFSQVPALQAHIAPRGKLEALQQDSHPFFQALYDRAATLPTLAEQLEGLASSSLNTLPPHTALNSIAYVTHVDFPKARNGYTRRSDAIVKALENNTITVHRICSRSYIEQTQKNPSPNLSLLSRINMAAEALAADIPETVSTIIAASDWTNGWVALLAARKRGLRFAYEVRGQWQLTHSAIVPGYQETPAFSARNDLERTLAKSSDATFCQTADLAAYLMVENKAILIPNGAEKMPLISNTQAQKKGYLSLGYVGSILPYEGLERAIEATAALHAAYPHLSLTIIGEGSHKRSLENLVKNLRATSYIRIIGAVPHKDALDAQYNFNALVLPRHDKQVCHIVEPLKPLEAFGLGKPVLATPLKVLQHMPGVLHADSFEISAFSDLIEDCINNPDKLVQAGHAGHQWVQDTRLWNDLVYPMASWINTPSSELKETP